MKRKLIVGFMMVLAVTGIFLVKAGKAVAEQELIVSAAASSHQCIPGNRRKVLEC